MSATATIALGGNLGDVDRTFQRASDAIENLTQAKLLARSRNYSTLPIGTHAGDAFRNAVIRIEVDLSPLELLHSLQQIEDALGRIRTRRWGPRTLDLDILSYNNELIELPPSHPSTFTSQVSKLTIPHPACWYRRFVLDPWCDIADDWRHPVHGETVHEMRERLRTRPLRIGIGSFRSAWKDELIEMVRRTAAWTDVEFSPVNASSEASHFEFQPSTRKSDPTAKTPRTIWLPETSTGITTAIQIIQAALDEPTPLEESQHPSEA